MCGTLNEKAAMTWSLFKKYFSLSKCFISWAQFSHSWLKTAISSLALLSGHLVQSADFPGKLNDHISGSYVFKNILINSWVSNYCSQLIRQNKDQSTEVVRSPMEILTDVNYIFKTKTGIITDFIYPSNTSTITLALKSVSSDSAFCWLGPTQHTSGRTCTLVEFAPKDVRGTVPSNQNVFLAVCECQVLIC